MAKQLFIVLTNRNDEEIFSGYIQHIDCVASHTIIWQDKQVNSGDIVRFVFPCDVYSIQCVDSAVHIYYKNGVHAEITRK